MTYPKNVTVWDFETTGLDPFIHKPIEAAWVVVKDNHITKARRYFLNYNIDIPEQAAAIHGITRGMIEDSEDSSIPPEDILKELICDIFDAEGHVTHNGTHFDLHFLANNYGIADSGLRETHIDTAAIFKGRALRVARVGEETLDSYARRVLRIHSTFKYNLRAACEAHGIPVGTQHRAMDDVILTHKLYKKMFLKV